MQLREPGEAQVFDLVLADLRLEAGAVVEPYLVRGWWWGPTEDLAGLNQLAMVTSDREYRSRSWQVVRRDRRAIEDWQRKFSTRQSAWSAATLSAEIPTILLVHALTGDMRAGGPGGWWDRVVGPGKVLDPRRYRLLCFNLLGSCYGSSGPADEGFARRENDEFPAPLPVAKGHHVLPENLLPATVTTWDQARGILLALDALGIDNLYLAAGGSLGAMIILCLAALAPHRIARIMPIGAADRATSWVIGWNHVQRQAILLDPNFPADPRRGVELARQIGMLTYRAEEGTELRQGRQLAGLPAGETGWSSRAPYQIHTYLEHQGQKLVDRFDSGSYLALLSAMDHHDIRRRPSWAAEPEPWDESRLRASALCVGIDSDQLFFPAAIRALAERLSAQGGHGEYRELATPFGHDGFLIETDKVNELMKRAVELPAPR